MGAVATRIPVSDEAMCSSPSADQRERPGHLDEREHHDRAEAAAEAPEHAQPHGERHEDERRQRGAHRDDRPRREPVVEGDLDEEVRGAPDRVSTAEQDDGRRDIQPSFAEKLVAHAEIAAFFAQTDVVRAYVGGVELPGRVSCVAARIAGSAASGVGFRTQPSRVQDEVVEQQDFAPGARSRITVSARSRSVRISSQIASPRRPVDRLEPRLV